MSLYAEGFDKICFIVDRDRESFVAHPENNQYKYVLDKCREKGFGFYLTNPCFEFWLLLHFDDAAILYQEKLLDNRKVTVKRRYTEHELRRRMKEDFRIIQQVSTRTVRRGCASLPPVSSYILMFYSENHRFITYKISFFEKLHKIRVF